MVGGTYQHSLKTVRCDDHISIVKDMSEFAGRSVIVVHDLHYIPLLVVSLQGQRRLLLRGGRGVRHRLLLVLQLVAQLSQNIGAVE